MVTTSEPVTVERWHELSPGRTSCTQAAHMRSSARMDHKVCAHLRRVNLEQPAADQAPHEQRLDVHLDFSGVHVAANSNLQHNRAAVGAVVERVLKRTLVFLACVGRQLTKHGHCSTAPRTCGGRAASGASTSSAVRFGGGACGADPSPESSRIACSFRAASRASRSAASSRCCRSRASGPQLSSPPSLSAGFGCTRQL